MRLHAKLSLGLLLVLVASGAAFLALTARTSQAMAR